MSDENSLDVKVFRQIVRQVAFETMEQFQTRFGHITENSNFSVDLANLDDLNNLIPRSTLLNEECEASFNSL